MNRKQKRQMAKNLGILDYQAKLPRNKKFELIRQNIIEGKKRQLEVKEEVRQQENKFIEEKESQIVYHIAEDLAKKRNVQISDVLEEAQKIYMETY
jgi:hypothetical protein